MIIGFGEKCPLCIVCLAFFLQFIWVVMTNNNLMEISGDFCFIKIKCDSKQGEPRTV